MRIFLGLGSNEGSRLENLLLGCESIKGLPDTRIINISHVYETPPLYNEKLSNFYNLVIEINSKLNPAELLNKLKKIELLFGRDLSNGHNLSRKLDIDILAYGHKQVNKKELVIPHSKIFERKFVLQPWSDIAEDFILIGMNKTIKSLLSETTDSSKIHRVDLPVKIVL